jgi:hypothetical protein
MQNYFFDASKNWVILAPPGETALIKELALFIARLRTEAKLPCVQPPVLDGSAVSGPADGGGSAGSGEIIVNYDPQSKKNAYAWRAAAERVEIYAHSPQSLKNAIADFISAFTGERHSPVPTPPPPVENPLFKLSKKSNHSLERADSNEQRA